MAFGDLGGAVTEMIITCMTPEEGTVNIAAGDAVKLTGPYTVTNVTTAEDRVFGQAMNACSQNGAAVPVKIRGVCVFRYDGTAPDVDGSAGVLASGTDGKVKAPATGNGFGINLKVDTAKSVVHVLI